MKRVLPIVSIIALMLLTTVDLPSAQPQGGASEEEIRKLVEALDQGRAAWINGQTESSATNRMVQAEDMTIFGPFGGAGVPESSAALIEAQRRTAAQFKGGKGRIELLKAMSSGDLLVLVSIERNEVNFEAHESPQPWVLRTTQVFRREQGRWARLHRHADPLIKQRSLSETLALY